jgi:drug/metabolite transporter (DMT)-like permease
MKQRLTPTQEAIGPASLLTVGLLYGLSAVIAKYLSRFINAYQVIEYRFGIAFIAAVLILLLSKKRLEFKQVDPKILAAFAITFPTSAILFTLSVFHASVALAVFSFYAANLVAQFVIGKLYFNEKVNLVKGFAILASVASLVAFTNPFSHFTVTSGLAFGLIAGVVQAIASSFQKLLSSSTDKTSLLILQTLAGVVMAVIILALTGKSLVPSLNGFAWFSTVVFGLGMLAIMYLFLVGYKYTNLNIGSILVSSELFFGPFFALLLLSERIAANVLIGGVFTTLAAVLVSVPPKSRAS